MTQIDANLQTDIEKVLNEKLEIVVTDPNNIISPAFNIEYGIQGEADDLINRINEQYTNSANPYLLTMKKKLLRKQQACEVLKGTIFELMEPIDKNPKLRNSTDAELIWEITKTNNASFLNQVINALNDETSTELEVNELSTYLSSRTSAVQNKLETLGFAPSKINKKQKKNRTFNNTNRSEFDKALYEKLEVAESFSNIQFWDDANSFYNINFDLLLEEAEGKNDDEKIAFARAQLFLGCFEVATLEINSTSIKKNRIELVFIDEDGEGVIHNKVISMCGETVQRKIRELKKLK